MDNSVGFNDDNKLKVLFVGDSLSVDLFVASSLSSDLAKTVQFKQADFDDECAKNLVTNSYEINHDGERCLESGNAFLASEILKQSQVLVLASAWLSNAKYLEHFLELTQVKEKEVIIYKPHAFSDIESMILSLDGMEDSFSSEGYKRFVYFNRHQRTMNANLVLDEISKSHALPTINAFEFFCDNKGMRCNVFSDEGYPLIVDQAHLSSAGLKAFSPWFSGRLRSLIEDEN